VAYVSESLIRDKVMVIVNALKEDTNAKPNSAAEKKMSKAERQKLVNEKMQIRVQLINDLTSLIPVYSDAVCAYIRAFQQVAICVEAVSFKLIVQLLLKFLIE
jgi:hypothetical protein